MLEKPLEVVAAVVVVVDFVDVYVVVVQVVDVSDLASGLNNQQEKRPLGIMQKVVTSKEDTKNKG